MPNAIIELGLMLGIGAVWVLSYRTGVAAGRKKAREEAASADASLHMHDMLWCDEQVRLTRERAFKRAAEAVSLWPHRIYKRADLVRHLESLATAPAVARITSVEEMAAAAPSTPGEAPIEIGRGVPKLLPPKVPENRDDTVEGYHLEGLL